MSRSPTKRHVQGARNGRSRHGQNIHLSAHLLDALFVPNAKALLFVDHQQTEVGELHVFREQSVRADQDVNFADREFFPEFL